MADIHEIEMQIIQKIKSIGYKDGDILHVVYDSPNQQTHNGVITFLQQIKTILRQKFGIPDPCIIYTSEGFNFSILDEKMMNQHGWFKKQKQEEEINHIVV